MNVLDCRTVWVGGCATYVFAGRVEWVELALKRRESKI